MATIPTINSTDLTEGSIWNESGRERSQTSAELNNTPSFSVADFNEALASNPMGLRGYSYHMGGGVWVTFCSECNAYARSWGHVVLNSVILDHKRDEHGISEGPLLP